MTRYLRIAAAVVFAVLAISFIALWVRSHSKRDELIGPIGGKRGVAVFSTLGVVDVIVMKADPPSWPNSWRLATVQIDSANSGWFRLKQGFLGLEFKRSTPRPSARMVTTVGLPYWFLAASSFALAAVLGLKRRWRFTVRGLLIATTLLAMAPGLGVALS